MATNTTPACVIRLLELSRQALDGYRSAAQQLRLAGELLGLAGGAQAMCHVQGLAHDYALTTKVSGSNDLAGHIGAHWEHIPAWAAL